MTTYTPGPWRVERMKDGNGHEMWNVIREVDCGAWQEICQSYDTDSESLDNATLIAIAPELLEACEMAHEFISILENKLDRPETFMIAQFSPILAKLHASIAKAKREI